MNQLAVVETNNTEIISNLVLNGDIKKMDQVQRVQYYNALCQSLDLNPLTQPFQIITLSGKEVLYATRTATDQLRKINGISIDSISQKFEKDICITTVSAHDKTGRVDGATGAVNVAGLKGDALCNAIMKSETKAKRRVTLSLSGLGIIDESEIETIPNAEVKKMTIETGQLEAPETKPGNGKKQAEPATKSDPKAEASAKIAALPDDIKKGFMILDYGAKAIYAFCTKYKWNNATIKIEINKIVDGQAK